MGDLQGGSGRPDGVVTEDCLLMPSSEPDPLSMGEGSLVIAEKITKEVVWCIHPTLDSDEKRKDVIEYIQRLIRLSVGCEVFPYGSVPLKTYLPDGDIDLTALCSTNVEETLARDVLAVLQGEEQNENAEYEVKDTQFIDAEVKLVKCLVQNIVIDISFNQLGGLCTLCFLEQVDHLVGRDHLFKRSIILIKAWCYYESRILGAHHGLLSTYALETLVLYIFHLFHASLNGPLAVLYKFLEYFSQFDWDNYCISLQGPVSKSSLPDIVVEMPANVGNNLMLSEEFLKKCMDVFSVTPSRVVDTNVRAFPQKHLNIIDPLKENNNLGRSVHRGNYYRIRSAFKYGARKLGRILLLPRERIEDELKRFFANSLERHGDSFNNGPSSSLSRTFSEEAISLNLNLDLDNNIPAVRDSEIDRYPTNSNSVQTVSKMACTVDGIGVSGSRPAGEASLRGSDTPDCSQSSRDLSHSPSQLNYHAPHFDFSGLSLDNGNFENEEKLANDDEKMRLDSWTEDREDDWGGGDAVSSCSGSNQGGLSSSRSGISSPVATISDVPLDFREMDLSDIFGSPETLNPLSELSGDYDSHLRSLLYGQCCHGYASSVPVQPNSPSFPSQFQSTRPWDTVCQSIPLDRNASSHWNTNGPVFEPTQNPMNYSAQYHSPFCLDKMAKPRGTGTYFPDPNLFGLTHENSMNNPAPSGSRLYSEEKYKPRGTGTFIPDSNGCSCKDRWTQGRGKNQAAANHRHYQRHTRNNNNTASAPAPADKKQPLPFEERSQELPYARSQSLLRRVKSQSSHKSPHTSSDDSRAACSSSSQKLEFGSLEHLPVETSRPASDSCNRRASTPSLVELEGQSSKAVVLGNTRERVAKQLFRLKNNADFPPLTNN